MTCQHRWSDEEVLTVKIWRGDGYESGTLRWCELCGGVDWQGNVSPDGWAAILEKNPSSTWRKVAA